MNENKIDPQTRISKTLQIIIAGATIIGLGIGVLNFFILTQVTPLEKRVMALEKIVEESSVVLIQARLDSQNIKDIKADVRDIKNYLNIR